MKQITRICILFLTLAAFCTLQAQDNTTGAGSYDPGVVPTETAPQSGIDRTSFSEDGIASWYGTEFEGRPTASGELFNPSQMTAAHPTLPFGTMLRVTNTQNRKQVIVRVNDRGPFVNTRIIDISRAAAEVLDMISTGTAPVKVEMAGDTAVATQPAASHEPAESDPWIAPIPAYPPAAAQQPAYPAYPTQPPATAQQPVFSQPPASVSSTPAVVKPKMPPLGTYKRYRIQVGAYTVTKNAVEAFDRVKSVGLEPAYERYNDYYRVVITGIPADDIQNLAGRLGSVGFREILIREE